MKTMEERRRAAETGLAQLRHDLLNPLNVLVGVAAALRQTELSDVQRGWVDMLESTTQGLEGIVQRIGVDGAGADPRVDGRERLADLLSIAAARVGKPFTRDQLVAAIEHVAGRRPLRILLVDDSPALVWLVTTFLRDTGWEIDVVENGERAVAQGTSERYDVVLMDIDLPGLDGATAAHAIRAAELARGVSPTPVIAMTAFDCATPQMAGPASRSPQQRDDVQVDDPEIAPLIPDFLANRRAEVPLLRQALEGGEYATVQASAHKLKGSGRGYGFVEMSRLGGELELAAHEGDVERMTYLIDELDSYLRNVRIKMG